MLSMPCWMQAQMVHDGGDIVHDIRREGVQPIAIQSANPDWAALAERAFSTHGGFQLADANRARFTFTLTPDGSNRCRLVIQSGRPAQTVFQAVVTGSSEREALLRACDLAVEKTLGIPGYFAGKLVFVGDRTGNRELWTSDLFFQNARQITGHGSKSIRPQWSPNGRDVLYTSYYRTGFPDLYLLNTDTGVNTVFADYKGTNTGGVFSPDGQRVAMILSPRGSPDLYVGPASGRNPTALTRDRAVAANPSWSPDGRRIVFTSDALGGPQLFVIPSEGGQPRHLSTRLSGYVDEPDWNPRDPNKIVFTASTRSGYQLGLIDLGTNRANWVTSGGDNSEPSWLNDGRHVVYVRRTGKWHGLRILDTETGKDTALHTSSFGNAWQPDFVYPR